MPDQNIHKLLVVIIMRYSGVYKGVSKWNILFCWLYIMNHFDNQISGVFQGQSFNIKHQFHVEIYDSSWINKHPLTRSYFVPVLKEDTMKNKLLLVDDEKIMLKYLSKFLIKRGFDITTAMNGEDALEKIKNQDFTTVLLDVLMPGMDGIETLKEIKKIKPMTEVIMLTGHASVQVAIEGMKLGAFDYLMKPFDRDELVVKLRMACEKRLFNEKGIDAVNIPEMMLEKPA